jgi:hypothetical protein
VIQLFTPQQRAALILCDVLGWSAKDAADLLVTDEGIRARLNASDSSDRISLEELARRLHTDVAWQSV